MATEICGNIQGLNELEEDDHKCPVALHLMNELIAALPLIPNMWKVYQEISILDKWKGVGAGFVLKKTCVSCE